MPKYKYTALDDTSSIVKGQMDAGSEAELKELLAAHGQKLIKVHTNILSKSLSGKARTIPISSDEMAVFCKQLSIITRSGISIHKGLIMVRSQSTNKKIRDLAENVSMGIQKGSSLSNAFRNSGFRLPLLFINMVQVGELSGNLDEIFRKLAEYFEKESRTRKKITAAMIYPVILIFVSVGVIAIFAFFVLPQLVEIIQDSDVQLPIITRIMMGSSEFVVENKIYIALGIILLAVLYFKGIPYEKRRKFFDSLMLKMPAVSGVARDFLTARFVRTMGMLVKIGLSMLTILETLEKLVGNDNLRKGIAQARERINKGESLSSSLEQIGFFDSMVTNIIAIGEETGNLGESLLDLADYYDEKFDSGVSKLISMIEPAFTLGMGAVIAAILLSAMLPVFDMIGSFSNTA